MAAMGFVGKALGALLLLGLGSCASLDSDWHLAPLVTQANRFDGGMTREIAGGAYLALDPPADYAGTDESTGRRVRALRPLFAHVDHVNGDRTMDWFPPLGRTTWRGPETSSYFFPIYTARATPPDGKGRVFSMLLLPGVYWTQDEDGTDRVAWFPLYGDLRDVLTFSRVQFALVPRYVRTDRAGNRTDNVLFPVFSYTRPVSSDLHNKITQLEARPENGWRVWPLAGRIERENSYDRKFALWPVFQLQDNHLERPEENQEHLWSVFPLLTSQEMGTYRGFNVLWPFFGWASDPRGDFWSFDAPWPLVRFQRGDTVRSRIWPFFGHLKADGVDAWSVAWPLIHWRTEDYRDHIKKSYHVLPFWRQWTSYVEAGPDQGKRLASWKKLWPLWSQHIDGTRSTTTLTPLNPLWRSGFVDFHWGWLYELYREVEDGDMKRERAWMGLWRRERNSVEDRRSLSGLWSRRVVHNGDLQFTETSWLFGLLRWRSSSAESGLMRPAFPGPGWPAMEQAAPATRPPSVFPSSAPTGGHDQ